MLRRLGLCLAVAAASLAAARGSVADKIPAPIASVAASSGDAAAVESATRAGGTAELPLADRAVVRKSERRLYLMKGDNVLRSYRIALGLQPAGSKERSGDFRTPEGEYQLTRRNAHSDYFLSIQVSYPNAADLDRARRNRWPVGGSIMVHGLPNSLRHSPDYYATADWTDGCIALSNADMVEFWLLSRDNMPIDIMP
jgi:murein L,D-transpeptidase YafK